MGFQFVLDSLKSKSVGEAGFHPVSNPTELFRHSGWGWYNVPHRFALVIFEYSKVNCL